MHIYPGLNYYVHQSHPDRNPVQTFWHPNITKTYLQTVKQYEDDILFNLASHIHRGKILAPVSQEVPNMNLRLLVSPSISPVYFNNPAFSRLWLEEDDDLGKLQLDSFKYVYFNLLGYLMFGSNHFREIDLQSTLGMDLSSADSIRGWY